MCNIEFDKSEYINIQTGEKLDLEKVNKLKDNAMLKVNPTTWKLWDFEKNSSLGLDIWKMTKGAQKKIWWYCPKCNDSYPQAINKKVIGRGCAICKGYFVTERNSFGGRFPDIASEWHPTKNGELTPHKVSYGSGRKVWWLGTCGHEWEATPHNRGYGTLCPYCTHNPKVLAGHNDLWTTHPNIAKLLNNPDDGYKYTFGSHTKVYWKCDTCAHISYQTISDLVGRVSCRRCKDKVSFGEKIVYALLSRIGVDFNFDCSLPWSDNRRYDFYIPSLNIIIETHGEQHYKRTFVNSIRTLEEEQENDKYKYKMAIANGIEPENYIVIDCSKGDFESIKVNILSSNLKNSLYINESHFIEMDIRCNKFTIESWNLWNQGYGVMYISRKLKLSKGVVRRYLKLGYSLNKCDYKVENRYEKRRYTA